MSNERHIAISDIHGYAKTFIKLVKQIRPSKDDTIYILGDCFDRGPNSKAVFDVILRLKKICNVIVLMGNHEYHMFKCLELGPNIWLHPLNGASETIKKFGNIRKLQSYCKINDLYQIPKYVVCNDYILVHAGFRFEKNGKIEVKVPNDLENRDLSTLQDEIDKKNIKIIHGHTLQKKEVIKDNFSKNKSIICIDAGCYSTKYGYLCAFEFTKDSEKLFFQKRDESEKSWTSRVVHSKTSV